MYRRKGTWNLVGTKFLGKFMIQMDIGGHPPFPTGSKQLSEIYGNLLFLAVFTSRA
jgi:hypothetical protein